MGTIINFPQSIFRGDAPKLDKCLDTYLNKITEDLKGGLLYWS